MSTNASRAAPPAVVSRATPRAAHRAPPPRAARSPHIQSLIASVITAAIAIVHSHHSLGTSVAPSSLRRDQHHDGDGTTCLTERART